MSEWEASAEIVTRDVAVRVECPKCGTESDFKISDFDYTALWYGEESFICPNCHEVVGIYHVWRV